MSVSINNTTLTFTDATTQLTAFAGVNVQIFNANGTFTIPTGITKVKVTVCGGGGTGGTGYDDGVCVSNPGGGGGGAGVAIKWLTGLTPGNTITVTRGAANGSSSIASGTQTITTVTGGGGGAGGNAGGAAGNLGTAGTATNGDLNFSSRNFYTTGVFSGGAAGTFGGIVVNSNVPIVGMLGGSSGIGNAVTVAQKAASGYGNGGGAGQGSTGNTVGGVATAGIVIFEW
jgi:hypothetical protein